MKCKPDWLLLVIYWGIFVSNQNNSIISSFLPSYAISYVDIDETLVGIIFGVFSVGVFASSMVAGKIMNKKGRKKLLMILGFGVMAIGNVIFAVLIFFKGKIEFMVIASIARVIIGVGQGLFMAPAFSIVPIVYKQTFENKIGIMEALSGLGLSIGPVFGGIFYSIGEKTLHNDDIGFVIPFIYCVIMSVVAIPIALKYVPSKPKAAEQDVHESLHASEIVKEFASDSQRDGLKDSEVSQENQEQTTQNLDNPNLRSEVGIQQK